MEVSIDIKDIVDDIRAGVTSETDTLKDEAIRDRVRLAANTRMLKRSISGASAVLVQDIHRFLRPEVTDIADDGEVHGTITYELIGSARRFDGKEKSIALKLHEALVELSLQRFLATVGLADLSKLHAGQAVNVLTELEALMRQKSVPKLVEP